MSEAAFKLLNDEVQSRDWAQGQAEITKMTRIYEGELPAEFDKYFPQGIPKHVVNLVRLAWDDLATQAGKVPELRSEPANSSDAELKRVGLHEKIGMGYGMASEPSLKLLMWELAWWLIGTGMAVEVVKPHPELDVPIFSLRDPRTAFPGAKRKVGNQIVELDDIMFRYKLKRKEMVRRGLTPKPQNSFSIPNEPTIAGDTDEAEGVIIEFIDRDKWMTVSDGGTVQYAEHKLGVVPAHVYTAFAPNLMHGLSQFEDQVAFMVAISRLITQKLAFGDRVVYPIYWVKGLKDHVRIGPMVVNELKDEGQMGQLTPPVQLQADRDIEMLSAFSRILNRNPQVRQGEVQGRGTYVSAKTLEQLAESLDSTVGRYWDIISVGKNKLWGAAFRMDELLWPEDKKTIPGGLTWKPPGSKKTIHGIKYTPSKDIKGRYNIKVDYGFGLGGYQGFLQQLQAHASGLQSKRRAVESMPGVSDVDELLREIELEKMDEAGQQLFMTMAQQGALDVVLWGELRKKMADEGIPLSEVVIEYQERIQEAAQAAQQTQGGPEPATAAAAPAAPEQGETPLPGISPFGFAGLF